ncbi:UNKNOWN [Stylonychia lemnae]|uniref:Uncharacterized protein n=1 Tax=Stylonychia lemnae TaxID=5949 RepID=A0A077ZRT7_STYLE|nr:UNKNOWN [Stylonychia lemnae]|eukprot:CDW72189.1 UNKNOWN [Stylonychia lemnae]
MILDFAKLFTLQCALLSKSMDFNYELNLNVIFIDVPSIQMGYEGFNWFSEQENNIKMIETFDQSFNMVQGMHRTRAVFQGFSRDNIVVYYERDMYSKAHIVNIMEQLQQDYLKNNVRLRLYFGTSKPGQTLQSLIDSYWKLKPKDITFSGSIEAIVDYELNYLFEMFRQWRVKQEVKKHFGFTSKNIMEFKNEFLELLKMPPKKDFFVYLWADDCPKCKEVYQFYNDLADNLKDVSSVHVAQTDMTASIFWGIWPYGLPYCRFYVHTITNNFEYVYEQYTIEAYLKFLKKKSTNFSKYLIDQKKRKAFPPTLEQIERDWHVRHCVNLEKNPKMLMDHLRYWNPDYESIVELVVQEEKYRKSDGYNIYVTDTYEGITLGQPFFRIVRKTSGNNVGVILVGQPLASQDKRDNFLMLAKSGQMIMGIQSYRNYPHFSRWEDDSDSSIQSLRERWQKEYFKNFAGWLHNMDEPHKHWNSQLPRLNFAESDLQFSMVKAFWPDNFNASDPKIYDLALTHTGNTSWHMDVKNWTLATKCIDKMLESGKYTFKLLGRKPPEEYEDKFPYIEFAPFKEFLGYVGQAEILLITSMSDASPRILTQALALNVAVILNKHIYGGKKYINEQTGSLIETEDDLFEAIEDIKRRRREGILQPRKWFEQYSELIHQKLEVFTEMIRKEQGWDLDINGYREDITTMI